MASADYGVSGEWSRTMQLTDEINLKLSQANAICNVTRLARDIHADGTIADALLAATDLIEESQKAFKELWETVIKKTQT